MKKALGTGAQRVDNLFAFYVIRLFKRSLGPIVVNIFSELDANHWTQLAQ